MKTKSKINGHIIRGVVYALFLAVAFIAASSAFDSPNKWYKSAVAHQAGAQVRNPNASPFPPSDTVHQAWVRRYNGPGNGQDSATAMAVDSTGNVYVTGASSGSGTDLDYATIKYNSAGQQQWVARYNGPGNSTDVAFAIAVDGVGNVYVTGTSVGSDIFGDYATIKYNSAGQRQWVARYNGPGNATDVAFAIALDAVGNVYVTGDSSGLTDSDYVTIKYNWAGQEQWLARYDHGEHDYGRAIAMDAVGNVYVTGTSWGQGGFGYEYATVKYNSDGHEQWAARYTGESGASEAAAIAIDRSGNAYVTGYSAGPGTGYDYAIIKYSPTGQQEWFARYAGPGISSDYASAMVLDTSGNIYVTGNSNARYATIKYNPAGQQQWVGLYNGGNGIPGTAIAVDDSGNVYVTGGSSGGPVTHVDYATIKYNSGGHQEWAARYNGPGNGGDQAARIVVDGSSNVYVTGYSAGSGTGVDYATIKYVQGAGPTPTPTPTPWVLPSITPRPLPTFPPRPTYPPRATRPPLPTPR